MSWNLPPGVTDADIDRAAGGDLPEVDTREGELWCPKCGNKSVTYHGPGQRLNQYGGEEDTPSYFYCSSCEWNVNEYEDEFETYEDEQRDILVIEAQNSKYDAQESFADNIADDIEDREDDRD